PGRACPFSGVFPERLLAYYHAVTLGLGGLFQALSGLSQFAGDEPQVVSKHAPANRESAVGVPFGAQSSAQPTVGQDRNARFSSSPAFLQIFKTLFLHSLAQQGDLARTARVVYFEFLQARAGLARSKPPVGANRFDRI